jgi:inhibitor of KinA sporulation pathway (predicted exonuclease)
MEMVMESIPYYLVVDLEATCDSPARMPRAETEIIEIGAVLVDAESLAPVDEFQSFVRPQRHPKLTGFCTELTTITQADVNNAPRFPEVIDGLRLFLGRRRALFCSWGQYDKNQFEQDASYHCVGLPFGAAHLNLKKCFAERFGARRKLGMGEALRHVGLELRGTHHRGIDDARNIARLLPWVLGRVPGA